MGRGFDPLRAYHSVASSYRVSAAAVSHYDSGGCGRIGVRLALSLLQGDHIGLLVSEHLDRLSFMFRAYVAVAQGGL